jgi:hypothetical protein
MPRKIIALADYISAHDASELLSLKYKRPISPKYIRRLSQRKRNPVRTEPVGNRILYNREDIEACIIKEKVRS